MNDAWDAAAYARNGRFVADMAGSVTAWLDAQPGETILDLGCGDGALTERLAATGARVVGMDRSPDMVRAARERGLSVHLGSGEALAFKGRFDAVFSNAALHWMHDQDAVLAGVHRALRPGGRFVAELGGHGNIAAIRTALRVAAARFGVEAEIAGNNVFFTAAEYHGMLERHGFTVELLELAPRPTLLPGGIRDWLETFRRSLLEPLGPEPREALLKEVSGLLEPILCDREGHWYADYVRLRFRARKDSRGEGAPDGMVALP